jgi:hypothetical protein
MSNETQIHTFVSAAWLCHAATLIATRAVSAAPLLKEGPGGRI